MNFNSFLPYTFFLLIVLPGLLPGQNRNSALQDIRVDVVYLASDDLGGRETGTEGEKLAADYIATRFMRMGLSSYGKKVNKKKEAIEDYFYDFNFKHSNNPHANPGEGEGKKGRNVVAYLDKGAPTTVIIGAHYDHLGMGGFGSRFTGGDAIHNGADDNASGVASLLYLAERLKNSSLDNNNYLFLAFSGEEFGLFGSKAFTKEPIFDPSTVNYMLNMDMVGRLKEERVISVNGVGTSPMWKKILPKIKKPELKTSTTESGIGPSDHTSFYLKDLPVLHFFTGQHQEYHKPDDDSHLINYEGLLDVSNYIYALIEKLDKKDKLTFTKTKDEQKKARSFKVTLGVMPDYVFDGTGMRIDAVIMGRTAAKAGLKDGDIVLQMGEFEIKDVYAYMDALGKIEPGSKLMVKVKRGEEEVEQEVQF